MKTQYYTSASLDGFLATPDHSLDWLMQFGDTPIGDYDGFIANIGALAMGAHTYEWVLRHLVAAGEAGRPAWPYSQPTWVFSSRDLPPVDGAELRFVRGDVRPVHAEMRKVAGERNIWIVGGGDLAGQFHDQGLLDEMIITVAPVTLGAGTPLLPREISRPPMTLRYAKAVGAGFVELCYELPRAGDR